MLVQHRASHPACTGEAERALGAAPDSPRPGIPPGPPGLRDPRPIARRAVRPQPVVNSTSVTKRLGRAFSRSRPFGRPAWSVFGRLTSSAGLIRHTGRPTCLGHRRPLAHHHPTSRRPFTIRLPRTASCSEPLPHDPCPSPGPNPGLTSGGKVASASAGRHIQVYRVRPANSGPTRGIRLPWKKPVPRRSIMAQSPSQTRRRDPNSTGPSRAKLFHSVDWKMVERGRRCVQTGRLQNEEPWGRGRTRARHLIVLSQPGQNSCAQETAGAPSSAEQLIHRPRSCMKFNSARSITSSW